MKHHKISALIVAFALVLSMSVTVFASDINIEIFGQKQNFSTQPNIVNGRTMVDAKELFNALNMEYSYDSETKTLTSGNEDYNILITADSEKATGTRKTYTLDAQMQSIDNKIMVPLRFVAEQLGFKVDWRAEENTATIEEYNLIADVPDSVGKESVIKRARQLTEFKFIPLKDIPTAVTSKVRGVFEAGKETKGFPYSSVEYNDKFLCENVSFETFLSALSNPDSVLYTKDMYHQSNASTYYGIVCNGLVRYSLGITNRWSTKRWLDVPGIKVAYEAGEYTVDDLELCDVLHAYNSSRNHVAIITGIFRDERGKVAKVEVSEATRSTCKRRIYTPEDFYSGFGKNFRVCKYEYIDSVPPFDEETDKILKSGIDKQKPMIAVDYGNKSNYLYGDETVISVFAEGENTVQIICNDELIEEFAVNGYTKINRNFEKGYYIVKLANTEYFTEFAVCGMEIKHRVEDGKMILNVDPGDSQSVIDHMEFREAGTPVSPLLTIVELTEEEKQTGVIIREIPVEGENFKISFRNKYGIWTHRTLSSYYPISYDEIPKPVQFDDAESIRVKAINASYVPEARNPAIHAIDGLLGSRWATSGKGRTLDVELEETRTIDRIAVAFINGSKRKANFKLSVSIDGINYTDVFDGWSSGTTESYEFIDFEAVSAKYVRFTANGHDQGDSEQWTSLAEFVVMRKK